MEAAAWDAPAAHAEKDAAWKDLLAHLAGDPDGMARLARYSAAQGRCDGEKAAELERRSKATLMAENAELKAEIRRLRQEKARRVRVRRRKRAAEQRRGGQMSLLEVGA